MNWILDDKIITDIDTTKYKSFVYLIERLDTGKKYVGKKKLQRVNRKKIKGKKNRKVVKTDSDWREYYGSNDTLKNEVKELGKNCSRELYLDYVNLYLKLHITRRRFSLRMTFCSIQTDGITTGYRLESEEFI